MTQPEECETERLIQYQDGERWIRWHGNVEGKTLGEALAELRKTRPDRKFRLVERTDWVVG